MKTLSKRKKNAEALAARRMRKGVGLFDHWSRMFHQYPVQYGYYDGCDHPYYYRGSGDDTPEDQIKYIASVLIAASKYSYLMYSAYNKAIDDFELCIRDNMYGPVSTMETNKIKSSQDLCDWANEYGFDLTPDKVDDDNGVFYEPTDVQKEYVKLHT